MNRIALAAPISFQSPQYPTGSIIVREKLLTADAKSPEVLVAMMKRQPGFSVKTNDWEFLLINGDITKIQMRQKTGQCQTCHSSAKEKDFVFGKYHGKPPA
jgi:hypothetical protein